MDKKIFYRSLTGRRVFIPCKEPENGETTLTLLVSNTGRQMIPAFFSKESQTGDFDVQSLAEFAFPMLRNILIELPEEISGIVIEPFAENIVLDRSALAEYDSAVQGMTVEKHNHMKNTAYRKAENLPKGLADGLRRFLKGQAGVDAVWVLLAQNENEKFPHLVFAVDFFGSRFDLFPKLAEAIRPFMMAGQSFELIEQNQQMKPFLTDEACIYRRKSPAH